MLTVSRFVFGFLSIVFYMVFLLKGWKNQESKGITNFYNPFFTLGFLTLFFSLITDCFDGILARKWHCESNFGKLYDPLADKLIVSSFLILFSTRNIVHWLIPFLSITREIIVEIVRYKLKKVYVILQASNTAKYKTAIQFVVIFIIYLFFSYSNNVWGDILFIPSLLFSFHSLSKYLQIYWKYY
ncbi:CDP-alcohol phosphatidyltransferase family protein [Mycoplasma parvum]|nr:CDP-alcohol phosphatidyltransferase family protein [Mycoplasma parvum]